MQYTEEIYIKNLLTQFAKKYCFEDSFKTNDSIVYTNHRRHSANVTRWILTVSGAEK